MTEFALDWGLDNTLDILVLSVVGVLPGFAA